MLTGDSLQDRFDALTALLQAHGPLWRPVPFCLPQLPWEAAHPVLAAALRCLPDTEAARLETDPAALADWLVSFIPAAAALPALTAVPAWPAAAAHWPQRFEHGIPGRKWQQVCAFAATLPALDGPVLDWCAGKGYLARAVSHRFGCRVQGLEWDHRLCDDGNALNLRLQLPVQLVPCDVLGEAALPALAQARHAIALHACGDLHRHLLQGVVQQQGHGLHLAPCCYHLGAQAGHRPLSAAGRAAALPLDRDELRLAVQETVTAGAATQRLRQRKNAWRLGFDALQRQRRGVDAYLPVPPIADRVFQGCFADFCQHAAGLKGLLLPSDTDFNAFEARGWQRLAEVRRLELPRHAFRRALELWLVLDYALYLHEHGYRVALGSFCAHRITPRNLLLAATRGRADLPQ